MTSNKSRRTCLWLALLAALHPTARLAYAQETATPASSSEQPTATPNAAKINKPVQLAAVMVTATKRDKSVDQIPATINVLDGSELEKHDVQDISDVARLTPGVNVTTPPGNASRITIRGVSSEANTNPTAGVLYGDTSLLPSYVPQYTPSPYPFDMQDVEVLKGPQGTLFGASALNGAIRYVPMQPQFGELSGKYYVQYSAIPGGGHGFGTGAALNLPLDKDNRLALRVTAYDNQEPGYIDNIRTHDPNSNRGRLQGARAIVAWKPIDAFNISLSYATQRGHWNDFPSTGSRDGQLSVDNRPRSTPYDQRYDLASLKMDYDFGAFNLISESSTVRTRYNAFIEDSAPIIQGGVLPIVANTVQNNANMWSQEFRLASHNDSASPWSWTVGVSASRQSIHLGNQFFFGDSSLSPLTTAEAIDKSVPGLGSAWLLEGYPDYDDLRANVAVKEIAAFFDVTRKLGEDWELTLGGRLYKTQSGGIVSNNGLQPQFFGYPDGLVIDQTVKQRGFSPKASVLWHLNTNINLYALANKGYRVGGPQTSVPGLTGLATTPSTFRTDTLWNYELGMRSKWLDNKLSFDTSLFYENWKNPQVFLTDASGLGTYIGNVGQVVSKGAETSLQYLVPQLPGLSLKFSGAYTHAIITQPLTTSYGTTIASGTPWPLSPKWQTAATLDYEHSIGNWYIGGYLTNTYLSKAIYGLSQPDSVYGFAQWDAQIRLGNFNLPTSPELSLSVTNLTDHRGITNAFSGTSPAATYHAVTYVQPRTFMLRLTGSF